MIIVAGGSSSRFGADKLMADVDGEPLIARTIDAVAPHVDMLVVACRPEIVGAVEKLRPEVTMATGGETRTLSEMAGLAAVGEGADLIGIHDAARPLVTGDLIDALFSTAAEVGGAIPVVDSEQLVLERTTHRPAAGLGRAQTPQVFRAADLMAAYVRAAQTGFEGHDTAEVVQRFSGVRVAGISGDTSNIKVTFPDDMMRVRETIKDRSRT